MCFTLTWDLHVGGVEAALQRNVARHSHWCCRQRPKSWSIANANFTVRPLKTCLVASRQFFFSFQQQGNKSRNIQNTCRIWCYRKAWEKWYDMTSVPGCIFSKGHPSSNVWVYHDGIFRRSGNYTSVGTFWVEHSQVEWPGKTDLGKRWAKESIQMGPKLGYLHQITPASIRFTARSDRIHSLRSQFKSSQGLW